MADGPNGLCPSCEAPGDLGQSCAERVCARQGVHFIPRDAAQAALGQQPAQREPLTGLFIGDYLITGRLGKGGFGRVLLGLQRPLYRLQAAVKLLEFEGQDERTHAKILDKFENEAAALAVLQHPNIVRLLQYGQFQGRPFMAMEFIPGARTLQSEVSRLGVDGGSLDPTTVRHILTQILNGLESAHAEDIIHRDIKPENIMLQAVVGDPWHVKIVDFGLAKVVAESRETSLVLGTVHYMAPEQIEGKNLGGWTDLYAVGVIAFELMTGRRPFAGADAQQILRQKLDATYDPLARVADLDLPDAVATFLRRALARYPDQRFRSPQEVRDALGPVFDAPSGTVAFSGDLSRLMDSEELARLRRDQQRLEHERASLEVMRRSLEAERQKLASDRIRLESQRLGRPADVEYAVVGDTVALHRGSPQPESPWTPAGTSFVGVTGQVGPPAGPGASASGVVQPNTMPSGVWHPGFQTGVPPHGAAMAPGQTSRRRGWLWALLALFIGGGGAAGAALALGGFDPTGGDDVPVVASGALVGGPGAAAPTEPPPSPGAPTPSPAEPAAAAVVAAPPPAAEPEAPPIPAAVDAAGKAPPASAERGVAVETTLEIESDPPGARVYVDGIEVGVTPYTLRTRLGATHKIEIEAEGRPREVREIEVVTELVRVEVPIPAVAEPAPTPATKRPRRTPKRPAAREPASEPVAAPPTPQSGMQPIYVDD